MRASGGRRGVGPLAALTLTGIGALVVGCGSPSGGDTDTDGSEAGETGETDGGAEVSWCHVDRDEVDARVDALLADLTLAQKVTLMAGESLDPTFGVFWTPGVPDHDLPGLGMVDGPRGVSKNAANATAFPVGAARGATWDRDLERRVGEAMGAEARAAGASVLLAPTINILRHPRWGRAQETYGEDPVHVGMMGTAFVHGVQSQRVIASAKHFVANNIEDTRFTVNVTADERTLREVYLPAFERVVRDGKVASVMSAYNLINGAYAAENVPLLRDVLKDEWGFEGFVESDWVFGTRSTAPSVRAGLDIEMPSPMFYEQTLLTDAVGGGLDEALIDDAVARIARTQWCYALDTDPPQRQLSKLETPEHVALAREVAERAITLLRNENDALPIDTQNVGMIAVVGSLADAENIGDEGSSDVQPSEVVTALQGLVDAAGPAPVRQFDWPLAPADESNFDTSGAVVVVVGLTSDDEGEALIGAGDRESMSLSAADETLIAEVAARHDRVIVVLEGGSAIVVEPWIDHVEALVMAWYPGMEGGRAIASVLYGDVDASGRSPVAWPRAEADLPGFDNSSDEVTYERWHGYQHLAREGTAARFPFGFGLSFASLSIDDVSVDADAVGPDDVIMLSATVSNASARDGREVVQIYAGPTSPDPDRPLRALVGYATVDVAAGASESVAIEVPLSELSVWNDGWSVPAGAYTFTVARHVDDPGTTLAVTVSG